MASAATVIIIIGGSGGRRSVERLLDSVAELVRDQEQEESAYAEEHTHEQEQ